MLCASGLLWMLTPRLPSPHSNSGGGGVPRMAASSAAIFSFWQSGCKTRSCRASSSSSAAAAVSKKCNVCAVLLLPQSGPESASRLAIKRTVLPVWLSKENEFLTLVHEEQFFSWRVPSDDGADGNDLDAGVWSLGRKTLPLLSCCLTGSVCRSTFEANSFYLSSHLIAARVDLLTWGLDLWRSALTRHNTCADFLFLWCFSGSRSWGMQQFIGSGGRNVEFTLAASVWKLLSSAGAKQLPARTECSSTFHTDGKFSKFQNANGQEGFLMQQEVCGPVPQKAVTQ